MKNYQLSTIKPSSPNTQQPTPNYQPTVSDDRISFLRFVKIRQKNKRNPCQPHVLLHFSKSIYYFATQRTGIQPKMAILYDRTEQHVDDKM